MNEVFAPPGLMSPKDISDALQRVPEVKAWLATIEKVALDKAYRDGVEIPGWKVIRSTGSRVIIDSAAAIQTLIDAGFKAEQVAIFKAKGIGDLERVVGRNELPVILGDLLERRRGTESLVPVDDKRPAIDRNIDAAEAFK